MHYLLTLPYYSSIISPKTLIKRNLLRASRAGGTRTNGGWGQSAGFILSSARSTPHFTGLPPATSQGQHEEYATISREYDQVVNQPIARRLHRLLDDLGIGPLSMDLFDSVVAL